MAGTEVMGATQAVDSDDDLERAVLESETISAAESPDDMLSAMTRTLAPGTVALGPTPDGADEPPREATQIEVHNSGDPDDRSGAVIHGRYQLMRQLGKGGMGTVYIARHTTLPKTFAVKVLNARYAKRQDIAERFLQEARAVSLIEHENVVGVIDFGQEEDGSAFLVMEHLRGESLAAVCKREAPLSWPRVRHIMLQMCRALQAAHAAGVVHRDIKPENVLRVERHDDPDFIKVLDFGLAKLQVGGGLRLTATGMVLGTPDYMSPEQARGQPSDHRTDIYASGVMMYELLCGRVPFEAKTFNALRQKHLLEPPKPPSHWAPELGEDLGEQVRDEIDAIVLRALAKDPEQRFTSMAQLGEAIEAVGTGKGPVELPKSRTLPLLAERSLVAGAGGRSSAGGKAPDMLGTLEPAPPHLAAAPGPGSRKRGMLVGVAVAVVVAVSGLLGLQVAGVFEREPVVAPETSAPVSAAAPSPTISLRFETNIPVVVRDGQGGTPFGDQPTRELQLPRGDEAMRLVLWAEGYRELHVVVTPDRDQILEAKLEPEPEPEPEPVAEPQPETEPQPKVEPEPQATSRPTTRAKKPSESEPEPETDKPETDKPDADHSFAPEIRDPFGG